jgi:glycerol-3-phosphate acyltransferase PlsY
MNLFLACLAGYCLGNFSSAIIIGKIFLKKDVRDYGSGNAGATNAVRAFGARVGLVVFLLDVFKGVLAVMIGRYIEPSLGQYFAGIFVIMGHNWPAALKFKGGKGIATSIGVMLPINPLVALICVAVGLILIVLTKIVSIGSIAGVVLAPVVVLVFVRPIDTKLLVLTCAVSAMAIFRHRSNISRLLKGEENKFKKKE